jgi:hypothetical protein
MRQSYNGGRDTIADTRNDHRRSVPRQRTTVTSSNATRPFPHRAAHPRMCAVPLPSNSASTSQITLGPTAVVARRAVRTYSPVLRTADLSAVEVPWWDGRRRRFEIDVGKK